MEYVRNPPPQRRRHSDEDGDDDDDDNDENDYSEFSTDMPPIGTRVRRGPDWEPSFSQQDSNGPGTVVSQDPAGNHTVRCILFHGLLSVIFSFIGSRLRFSFICRISISNVGQWSSE